MDSPHASTQMMMMMMSVCALLLTSCSIGAAGISIAAEAAANLAPADSPRPVIADNKEQGLASGPSSPESMDAYLGYPSTFPRLKKMQGTPQNFIWFMHFHKAAGTSVGIAALQSGFKLAPYEPKTHGHIDLGRQNIRGKSADEIVRRLQQLRAAGVSFGSTEHWFPDPVKFKEIKIKAPWVQFMTVLRDPVGRTLSSYYFHGSGQGNRCHGKCSSVAAFAEAESNMMTRMLNGMPFGPLMLDQTPNQLLEQAHAIAKDQDAVRKAQSVLDAFDVVLDLASLDDAATADVLRSKLGWRNATFPKSNSHAHPEATGDTVKELQMLNAQDIELFEHYFGRRTVNM